MKTPIPGNSVKIEYQKAGTGTRVPDFWIFQTRTETGSLVSWFPDFSVIFDTPTTFREKKSGLKTI